MSRIRNFARAIASGYAAIAANVLFTLLSVPIALRYLSPEEFGLWSVVVQICSYLALIELGITGSVYRFLIDHKDEPSRSAYNEVLSAGTLINLVQGAMLVSAGWVFSGALGQLMTVKGNQLTDFQFLVRWQCVVLGIGLVGRSLSTPLQAHQRFDLLNYLQIGFVVVGFLAQWGCLALGWGVRSLPFATACATLAVIVGSWGATRHLGLLPPKGDWVMPSRDVFVRLFSFGKDVFLITVGAQLFFGSQLVVVGRALGLEAAAVWTICMKAFSLAQQFVLRVPDFATPALTEMYVRGEHSRLGSRFQYIIKGTVVLSILLGGTIAVSNQSFVQIWTNGAFGWDARNDALAACLLVSVSVSRCLTMCVGFDKKVAAFRYVYFLQGAAFVAGAWWVAPHYGFTGVLVCALIADLSWCGLYGLWRTARFFSISAKAILRAFSPALLSGTFFGIACILIYQIVLPFPIWWRFLVGATTAALSGGAILWGMALNREQRSTIAARIAIMLGRSTDHTKGSSH